MSVVDKLDAARHSLGGSNTGLAVCKSTSREIMGPKKKHVDYLIACTENQQFDIVNLADLLFERCRMPSWVVVSKALVTIHNLLSNGHQRFLDHMPSRDCLWNSENFQDKSVSVVGGYDMSAFIRRYSNYLTQKVTSFAEVEYDFCRAKRGPDGILRSLDTQMLIRTLRVIQTHLDSLLEVDLQSSEFNNGIINSAFVLLFKDMIKIFACYNDGMIKLLEVYSDMSKNDCKESLEIYKNFLSRVESIQKFLQVAQNVGVNENAIPDLVQAPSGLLEALQDHYESLEKGQIPISTKHANLAPITIPQTNEHFNFNDEETRTATAESELKQKTILQTAQTTQPGSPEDAWGTMFETDQPKEKTTSTSDDLLQLHSVFQAQQVQQAPVAYFSPQSDFGQSTVPITANQSCSQPPVNGFGQSNAWGGNIDVRNNNNRSTNPFDTRTDVVSVGSEAYAGDVLQPMNRPQPQGMEETGDLHSTLTKVVGSLDAFDFSSSKTPSQVGSGGHQWTAPKPKVKTGGANFQLGTTSGTTLSPTSPVSPTGSKLPMSPVGRMGAVPGVRPGYMQPAMYGGAQATQYGQQPMMRPQQNVHPNNPFANPVPNQALF